MNKLLFVLLFFVATSLPAKVVEVASDKNAISIDTNTSGDCSVTFVEKYSRYSLYKRRGRENIGYYLIKQNFEIGSGCFEGNVPAKIQVEARDINVSTGETSNLLAWSFETDGVKGEVEPEIFTSLYRSELPGCCGGFKSYRYHGLENGRFVVASIIDPLIISIVRSGATSRMSYVGVETNAASFPMRNNSAVANLFLGDYKGLYQTVAIFYNGTEKEGWAVASMYFLSGDERRQVLDLFDKENFKGEHLVVELACMCEKEPVKLTFVWNENGIDVNFLSVDGKNDFHAKNEL